MKEEREQGPPGSKKRDVTQGDDRIRKIM